MSSGPKFIRFFWPVIEAVRELGGSAKPREVVDLVLERSEIDDEERAERTKGGSLRVDNEIHWARNYLVWAGLLDGSKRGVWALTADGWSIDLDQNDHGSAYQLFKRVRLDRKAEWGQSGADDDDTEAGQSEEPPALDDHEAEEITLTQSLRLMLQGLSPDGFENLSKRLLAEFGLVQLRKVGQAGDRGIDVEGHLRVNAVVSFRVGVQCKLYADGNKIVPRQIREFQGALGPFDRGIFITTSVFTQQAEEQATSPGYKPIDLIDGERLLELLREHGLGTKQITIVDEDFFAPFK